MQTKHALVIDDNENNLEVLDELLGMVGISCTLVQDVSQLDAALATLTQLDIVFLDLEMPHVNGYEMLAMLHQEIGLDVPVVACTVHLNEIQTAREHGFHSFLGKPLNPKRFADQIRRIIDGEPVWEAR
ncbi:MAG: response regulator [Chloroflexi bacterium]|nr:response regulator [Chloroflexota bacterium]